MAIRSRAPVLLHGEPLATESTLGEEIGAGFQEALQAGPIGSLRRIVELDTAEQGLRQSGGSIARFGYLPQANQAPDSPLLAKADASARLKEAGLDAHLQVPEGGIRARTLDILISRKRDELRRQTILAQSPGGASRVSARVAGSLAGGIVDPANVALAFIPVVGQARYAAMLARAGSVAGRMGVRAGVGAAEGLVGAAIVEPFNFYANTQQQADYDAFDAMTSIAGGAFFGSALHAGAGLFGDMVRTGRWGRTPMPAEGSTAAVETRAPGAPPQPVEAPRAAGIDAAARERAIVLDRLAAGRPLSREQAIGRAADVMRVEIEADLLARSSGVAEPGAVAAARDDLKLVDRELGGLERAQRELAKDFNRQPNVSRKDAERQAERAINDRRADLTSRRERAESIIGSNKASSAARDELSAFQSRGEIPESWRARVDERADRMFEGDGQNQLSAAVERAIREDPFRAVRPYIADLPADVQQGAFRMAIAQAVTGRPIDVTPSMLAHHGDQAGAFNAADRNALDVAGADRIGAAAADQRLVDTPPANDAAALKEVADAQEATWREQAKAAELDEEEIADVIDVGRQAVQDANRYAQALKIAELCMLRAG